MSDYIELTKEAFKNVCDLPVFGEEEKVGKDKCVIVMNHDYYGSNLSSYRKPKDSTFDEADYHMFTVKFDNVPVTLNDNIIEEARKCVSRGWNKKYEALLRQSDSIIVPDSEFESVHNIIDSVIKELEKLYGEEVIVSDIDDRIFTSNKKPYAPWLNENKAILRVVFALRKKGLPKKGEAPSNCKECPYFEYAGAETSHEWIEFYPYCKKMKKALGDFGDKIENIARPDDCPLL